MYAITGISGNVGGAMARSLLDAGRAVRAVVRNADKGREWTARGCDLALAEMEDADALSKSFAGCEAVFILPPPVFDPAPGYIEAQKVIDAVVGALKASQPSRVVCLSTIGADAQQDNLLSQRTLMEVALRGLSIPVTFLRPGWFLENALWDVASARDEGVIYSFLQPADKPFSMVSARDVGHVAADLMQQTWTGHRIVELEGPDRVSPDDLAATFGAILGREVRVETVPRDRWEPLFRGQGMQNPMPRIRMLDGFNEGWISFPGNGDVALKGSIDAKDVLSHLVSGTKPS